MKTASGSCLLTNVTHRQVSMLEDALAVRKPDGWVFPEALVLLRASINNPTLQPVVRNKETP